MEPLTAGPRSIRSGNEYNSLFPAPSFSDPIVNRDGDVDDTIKLMSKIASDGQTQVVKLAAMLAGATTDETCRNIHDFVVKHIQYAPDKNGVEQLRTPARTWADRGANKGVDCDCMSIFCSSLLRELKIDHRFRVVSFSNGDFEHVYVVVPRDGKTLAGGQIILDGVIHQFDREKTFTKAQDYTMNGKKIQLLNGIPVQVLNGITNGQRKYTYSQFEVSEHNRKLRMFLLAQREAIQKNLIPVNTIHPRQAVENINYVLSKWENEHDRYTAVQLLAQKEQQYNPLTHFFRSILAFFDGLLPCESVCAEGYVPLSHETINSIKAGQSLGRTSTDGTFVVMIDSARWKIEKFALAPVRGAYLLLIRMNFKGMADKMAPGFFPVNYAGERGESSWMEGKGYNENRLGAFKDIKYNQQFTRAFGLTESEHLKARKQIFDFILRRFYNFGGEWQSLKVAILKGAHNMLNKNGLRDLPGYRFWCKYDEYNFAKNDIAGPTEITPGWKEIDGLNGIDGLGDPITAATITAAGTLLAAMASFVSVLKSPKGSDPLDANGNPIVAIDPNTGQQVATNPTTNPDPAGHPQAQINATTGYWTDPATNTYYNPVTRLWEKEGSNLKKYGLIGLALGLLGFGTYQLLSNKPKTQKKDGK